MERIEVCDVCKTEDIDFKLRCGSKIKLYTNRFYCVYKSSTAVAKMCYLHDIEFFHAGERKFLSKHMPFARALQAKGN